MAITNMAFTPPTGLNDATYSPQTPPNEASARAEIQGVSDQLRDYINNTLIPSLLATNIKADPISVNSGNTVQAQLAWLLAQIAIAATGAIPEGSIDQTKLAPLLSTKIDTALSNTGLLPTLLTTDKSSSVNAINEVFEGLNSHLADYEYQTPTILGRQIRLTKQSNTSRIVFKLASDIQDGAVITISLDGGVTNKNLKDVDGNDILSLSKGYLEVIADATFFTLKPSGASKIDTLIANYVIASGENINAGDLVEFINEQAKKSVVNQTLGTMLSDNSGSTPAKATLIGTDRVLMVYIDQPNGSPATACIYTIAGNSITKGTSTQITSWGMDIANISVSKINDSGVIVAYRGINNTYYGITSILMISGTTISVGTGYPFTNTVGTSEDDCLFPRIEYLKDNKAIVVYKRPSGMYACIITIGTATHTTEVKLTDWDTISASSNYGCPCTVRIDDTRIMLIYSTHSSVCKMQILSVSNDVITQGVPLQFTTIQAFYFSGYLCDDNKVMLSYNLSDSGYLQMATITNTSISVGTPVVFLNKSIGFSHISKVRKNEFAILYWTSYTNNQTLILFQINNDVITIGTSTALAYSNIDDTNSIIQLPDNKVFMCWSNTYLYSQIVAFTKNIQGSAIESGIAGQTKKFYDWRY